MPHDLHLLLASSVVPDLTPSPFLVSFWKNKSGRWSGEDIPRLVPRANSHGDTSLPARGPEG